MCFHVYMERRLRKKIYIINYINCNGIELLALKKEFIHMLKVRNRLTQHLNLKNRLKVESVNFNSVNKYMINIQEHFLPCT